MQSSTLEIPLDDALFKVLSSDSRREILRLLQERRMTGTELAQRLELGKPAVSEHLKRLHDAGLVDRHDDPERRWVYFSLSKRGRDILEPKKTRFILVLSVAIAALLVGSLLGVALYSTVTTPAQPIDIDPTGGGDAYGSGLAGQNAPGDVVGLGNGTYYVFRAQDVDLHNGTVDPTVFQVVHEPVTVGAKEPTNDAPGPDAPAQEPTTDTPTTPGPGAPLSTTTSALDTVAGTAKQAASSAGALEDAETAKVADDADQAANATDIAQDAADTAADIEEADGNTTVEADENATDAEIGTDTSGTADPCVATTLLSCPAEKGLEPTTDLLDAAGRNTTGTDPDGSTDMSTDGSTDVSVAQNGTAAGDASATGNATDVNATAAADAQDGGGVEGEAAQNATNGTAQEVDGTGAENATQDAQDAQAGAENATQAGTEDATMEPAPVPRPDFEGLLQRLADAPGPPSLPSPVQIVDAADDGDGDSGGLGPEPADAGESQEPAAGRSDPAEADPAVGPGVAPSQAPKPVLLAAALAVLALAGLLLWVRRR